MLNHISFRGVIMSGFYLFCLLLPLIAVAQDTSKPGMTVVFLYNEGNGEIKPRCLEIKGRHDFEPRYECYDGKSGELKAFERGEEWTLLAVTPVCFRNQLTDVIKTNCIAYQLKADNTSRYMCFDEEEKKYISFAPKSEWVMLESDHKECKAREFGLDVIKDFEFDISIPAQEDKGTDKQKAPIQKKEDKK